MAPDHFSINSIIMSSVHSVKDMTLFGSDAFISREHLENCMALISNLSNKLSDGRHDILMDYAYGKLAPKFNDVLFKLGGILGNGNGSYLANDPSIAAADAELKELLAMVSDFFLKKKILSFEKRELEKVMGDFSIGKLLALFRQDFGRYFSMGVGVWENYTLEQHIMLVLTQFERYFSHRPLPGGLSNNFFRTFIMLHDLGKPYAVSIGRKDLQHECTLQLMVPVLEELRFSGEEMRVAVALVSGDPLGTYLKFGNLNLAASEISKLVKETHLSSPVFFELMTIYYRCDAGSYTSDSGGIASLDWLFSFDHNSRVMDFSRETDYKVRQLAAYFSQH